MAQFPFGAVGNLSPFLEECMRNQSIILSALLPKYIVNIVRPRSIYQVHVVFNMRNLMDSPM